MLFFLVAFHMLSLTKALLLDNYHITADQQHHRHGLGDHRGQDDPADRPHRARPLFSNRLLYNLLWKTVLFGTMALLFRQVEELIPVLLKHGDLGAAIREAPGRLSPRHRFLIIHMWLYTLLFIYALASEAVRMVGRDGRWAVLLGPVPRARTRED